MSDIKKQHAIILGGSIAGLLAARALSEHFQQVTIIEKDKLDWGQTPRKGVPQGHQLHIVLARGLQIMESYFPGFTAELADGGAVVSDDLALDLRWFANGGYRPQVSTGMKSVMLTRPFLEETLRRRVIALPNVSLVDGTKVAGLSSNDERTQVTGVWLAGRPEQVLKANLVLDATGRGSKSPAWLAELGYATPETEEVGVKIRYASRLYRRPKAFRSLIVTGPLPPHQTREGVVQPVEGERMVVMFHGRGDQNPPSDEAGFEAYARLLLTPDVRQRMEGMEPLGDVAVYNIPKTRWLHYEKLARFPAGYLVLGDAVCALNPVYGQGMTSAALQVEALDKLLGKRPSTANFWRPYFKQIAKAVSSPWQITVGEDFLFPQTEGTPPQMPGFMASYMGKLAQAVNQDGEVYKAFFSVMHMVKPPTVLFHPRIIWRVLRSKVQPASFSHAIELTPEKVKI